MNTIELRIALTEEILRELFWHALEPEALVMTGALNKAIAEQQARRTLSLEGYRFSGVSITIEAGTIYAELSYMQQPAHSEHKAEDASEWTNGQSSGTRLKDQVRTTSEDSFPASDPPAWTGSETGSTREVGR